MTTARQAHFHWGANFAAARFEQGAFFNDVSVDQSELLLMGATSPENSGSVVSSKHLGAPDAAIKLSHSEVHGHLEIYTQPSEHEQVALRSKE